MPFTFKKDTGVRGVGYPYPDVIVKHKKKQIGTIHAPTWQTKDNKWGVRLYIKTHDSKGGGFASRALKTRFDSEENARDYLQSHYDKILALGLYEMED